MQAYRVWTLDRDLIAEPAHDFHTPVLVLAADGRWTMHYVNPGPTNDGTEVARPSDETNASLMNV
jgi:hypothetical protein